MSRPLCPYPKRAHSDVAGGSAEASSFSCVEAARYPNSLNDALAQVQRANRGAAVKTSKPVADVGIG